VLNRWQVSSSPLTFSQICKFPMDVTHVQLAGKGSSQFTLCLSSGENIQNSVLSFCMIVMSERSTINCVKESFVISVLCLCSHLHQQFSNW
jgi:hypothetical protein